MPLGTKGELTLQEILAYVMVLSSREAVLTQTLARYCDRVLNHDRLVFSVSLKYSPGLLKPSLKKFKLK